MNHQKIIERIYSRDSVILSKFYPKIETNSSRFAAEIYELENNFPKNLILFNYYLRGLKI